MRGWSSSLGFHRGEFLIGTVEKLPAWFIDYIAPRRPIGPSRPYRDFGNKVDPGHGHVLFMLR